MDNIMHGIQLTNIQLNQTHQVVVHHNLSNAVAEPLILLRKIDLLVLDHCRTVDHFRIFENFLDISLVSVESLDV